MSTTTNNTNTQNAWWEDRSELKAFLLWLSDEGMDSRDAIEHVLDAPWEWSSHYDAFKAGRSMCDLSVEAEADKHLSDAVDLLCVAFAIYYDADLNDFDSLIEKPVTTCPGVADGALASAQFGISNIMASINHAKTVAKLNRNWGPRS